MTDENHLPIGESVTRGALALLTTQPLTWGVSLLAATLIPRLLGAEALGQLAIVLTITTLASTVSVFGISEYLVRRFAQHPETFRRDTGVALTLQLITTCVGAALIALLGWLAPSSMLNYPLLLASVLTMLAAPAQTVLLSSFRGREHHRAYAWVNAGVAVLGTLGSLLVLLAKGNVVTATAAGGTIVILTTIIGWRLSGVRPELPHINRSLLRAYGELMRGGFPFLSWQLTLLTYGQIDRLLLGLFVPTGEVGWYAAAYQIAGIVVFVPTLVIAPLFPALSRSAEDTETVRRVIARTAKLLLLIMVLLGAGTIVIAPVVPRLLGWPDDFQNAVPLMTILALHLPVVAIDMVLGAVLMSIHRETGLVRVGIVAAIFNVVANFVFIPFFQQTAGNGAIGAASVTVLTELLMCVGAVILLPKRLLDPKLVLEAGRLTIAGAASVLVGLAVGSVLAVNVGFPLLTFVLSGSSTVLIYLCAAFLLRALTMDDVRPFLARAARLRR